MQSQGGGYSRKNIRQVETQRRTKPSFSERLQHTMEGRQGTATIWSIKTEPEKSHVNPACAAVPGGERPPACTLLPRRSPWSRALGFGGCLEGSWLSLRRVKGIRSRACQCWRVNMDPCFSAVSLQCFNKVLLGALTFLWSLIQLLPTLREAEGTWQSSLPGTQERRVVSFGCDCFISGSSIHFDLSAPAF